MGFPQGVPSTEGLSTLASGLIGNGMQGSWEKWFRTKLPGAI